MLIDITETAVVPSTGRTLEAVQEGEPRPSRRNNATRRDPVIPLRLGAGRWEAVSERLADKLVQDPRPSCLLDQVEGETTFTLEDVGAALGVTRERVRQIELSAAHKLRTLGEQRPEMAPLIRELAYAHRTTAYGDQQD